MLRPAPSIEAATAVVVTHPSFGKSPTTPASPKAKASPAAKTLDTVERKKQREALQFTIGNWVNIRKDNIKGGGQSDPRALDELEQAMRALAEFDKVGKPDNTASLIYDTAAAFFKIDKEAHDVLRRRRGLYQEIERGNAQKTLRHQTHRGEEPALGQTQSG